MTHRLLKALQDALSDANEVDALGDPKEGGYDQGTAACSFHEGCWPLLCPELPGTVSDSAVGVLTQAFLEGLDSSLQN